MNILIFSWRDLHHPNAGGAEISTHEHAKSWVKNGYAVTLFTSFYKGAQKTEKIDGVNIVRAGDQFLGVHWEAFKWYKFASHPKFDLVIDQFHGIPFFTPLYVQGKKLAFIHEVTKEVWSLNPWPWPLNLIPALVGRAFEPMLFKLLYKKIPFMAVSESTEEDLIEWGIPRKNITVVHNGVTVPKMAYPKKKALKTITFLGALAKDKGIEKALKVFSILQKEYKKNFQFWIIGKSDKKYLESLKQQVNKLGLKNIRFWGFVSERLKFELLANSHILLNPSVREGWGLVVIEAARMGTPAVAFDVPGLKDSILDGRTGLLSKEFTEESLANKIVNLLSNEGSYNRISHSAMVWSQNFSWDKASRASMNLIKRIMR